MENPLIKLVPQLFGEYPKPFIKLIENISLSPDQDIQKETRTLWKAYEFGLGTMMVKKGYLGNRISLTV